MKSTLYIELLHNFARIGIHLENEEQLHYIDVTGGYGKKIIPLCSHYLKSEDTILIGEDALHYDIEEDTDYIHNVLRDSRGQHLFDFIIQLFKKVTLLMPSAELSHCVVIWNEKQMDKVMIPKLKEKFSNISVEIGFITIEEAMVGFIYQKEFKSSTLIYGSQESMTLLFYNNDKDFGSNNEYEYKELALPLSQIDDYYIERILRAHQPSIYQSNSNEDLVSIHSRLESVDIDIDEKNFLQKIYRLYYDQIITLYAQMNKNKDVSIYSSIHFPPSRIILPIQAFDDFIYEFQTKYVHVLLSQLQEMNLSKETLFFSGVYDKLHVIEYFKMTALKEATYNENVVLQGAFEITKYELLHKKSFIDIKKINRSIGILSKENEFVEMISKDAPLQESFCCELIVTEYDKKIDFYEKDNTQEEVKPIFTILINDPKAFCILAVKFSFSRDRLIKEVCYEFRNL